MRRSAPLLLVSAVVLALPVLTDAHFLLIEPAASLAQDQRGDPQKLGPCGGTSANAGTPSNAVTKVKGGDTLHIKLQETIYHPGHYRIALAVKSLAELPPEPDVTTRDTEKGPWSVSAVIQNPPKTPVLADGLWAHTARPAEPFETDVTLPNINCEKCTLQIVQFMAEHGYNRDGGYFYHHCADLQITANAAAAIDADWPGQR